MSNEIEDLPLDDDDVEAAYQQALNSLEDAEAELGQAMESLMEPSEVGSESLQPSLGQNIGEMAIEEETATVVAEEPEEEITAKEPVEPAQIVEALLFVGGEPLTAKRIAGVLKGNFKAKQIENLIQELNTQYLAEDRPYTISLGEGGYAFTLRNEFDSIHSKVFGFGPKEVKLSQEILEVLALVAYHEPISRAELDRLRGSNVNPMLRQLLRRNLIVLSREEKDENGDVTYRTTPRFLDVFGLTSLGDLPQADDLQWK